MLVYMYICMYFEEYFFHKEDDAPFKEKDEKIKRITIRCDLHRSNNSHYINMIVLFPLIENVNNSWKYMYIYM